MDETYEFFGTNLGIRLPEGLPTMAKWNRDEIALVAGLGVICVRDEVLPLTVLGRDSNAEFLEMVLESFLCASAFPIAFVFCLASAWARSLCSTI